MKYLWLGLLLVTVSIVVTKSSNYLLQNNNQQQWYDIKCLKCKTHYESNSPGDIESCLNCEEKPCEIGGLIILSWAAIHTNEDKAKVLEQKFAEHAKECKSCYSYLAKQRRGDKLE